MDAFGTTLGLVETAKEAVVDAVPRARNPGRPLAEAILEFEEGLREAAGLMETWWHPSLSDRWDECGQGIAEALSRAEQLRLDAPEMSFDQLAFTVQDLIAPLEPFEAAAETFRTLRT
jgi:hypothetical protein